MTGTMLKAPAIKQLTTILLTRKCLVKSSGVFLETGKIITMEMMRCFEKHKISPILVVPPFLTDTLKDADTLSYIDKQKKLFYDVINKYGNNLQIYDCFELYKSRYDYFYDYEHLNNKGRTAFTDYIDKIINQDGSLIVNM